MTDFIIDGAPRGKERPRFGNGHAYTPQNTLDYEEKIKRSYLKAGGKNYRDAPIFMRLIMYYQIPKSASKKMREAMISGEVQPTKKPDFDNVCKAVADSLNGIAYNDDCQIVKWGGAKWYSENPRIEVRIMPLI